MTLTNDDLLAVSRLLDTKLHPLEARTKKIELLIENEILPRIQNIEACYTFTYRRYASEAEHMGELQSDMDIVKKVLSEHSAKLQGSA